MSPYLRNRKSHILVVDHGRTAPVVDKVNTSHQADFHKANNVRPEALVDTLIEATEGGKKLVDVGIDHPDKQIGILVSWTVSRPDNL